MATEAAWLERKESTGRKEKEKNILDSYRPSHGRHLADVLGFLGRWRRDFF
jgi:hypothetical protein